MDEWNGISDQFVFVEVGARKGARQFRGETRYVGFEPLWTHSVTSQARHYQQFQVYPYALSDENGRALLYETKHPGCSSLLEPNFIEIDKYDRRQVTGRDIWGRPLERLSWHHWPKNFEVVATHLVETRTLDGICDAEKIDHIDYLQLDTQGTELHILKGARGILEHTKQIHVEMELIELYQGQPLLQDIVCFLNHQGFRLIPPLENVVRVRQRQTQEAVVVSVDGLFERKADVR